MHGWVFCPAQKEWGHSGRPLASLALLPVQEPVAALAVTPALFELQRWYEAIRVWSYTIFIVIEASDQEETNG
jgi:hypothetical protein